ncbi:hypothetical protein G6F24_015414 [Rhizopus arrhizus]|nr:hypothetical protein G6F24_015414 [Rhizopus arrhizus]
MAVAGSGAAGRYPHRHQLSGHPHAVAGRAGRGRTGGRAVRFGGNRSAPGHRRPDLRSGVQRRHAARQPVDPGAQPARQRSGAGRCSARAGRCARLAARAAAEPAADPAARRLRQLPGQPGRAQQCLPGAAAGAAARHHRRLRDGGRHRRQGGAQERQDRWRAERQLAGQRRPGRR